MSASVYSRIHCKAVSIIEPGGIKTPWGFIAADHLEESAKGGVYEVQAAKTAAGMRKQYTGNMMSEPSVIAKAISKAVNARCPRHATPSASWQNLSYGCTVSYPPIGSIG